MPTIKLTAKGRDISFEISDEKFFELVDFLTNKKSKMDLSKQALSLEESDLEFSEDSALSEEDINFKLRDLEQQNEQLKSKNKNLLKKIEQLTDRLDRISSLYRQTLFFNDSYKLEIAALNNELENQQEKKCSIM